MGAGNRQQTGRTDAPARPRSRSRLRLLGVAVGLLLASMILDRLLPVVGLGPVRPTRLTLPRNLTLTREQLEFRYTIQTNSRGLRCRELPLAKPEGVRRIVLLGDSQTFGVGVEAEQTFGALLEGRLENAEVINCGRPRAHPLRQARIFYHVGLRYAPDLVVMCISANDLADMPTREIGNAFELGPRPPGLAERFWPNVVGWRLAARQRARYARQREPRDFLEYIAEIARDKRIADSQIEAWRRAVSRFPTLIDAAGRHRLDGNVMAFGLLWRQYWPESLDLGQGRAERAWRGMRKALGAVAAETSQFSIQFAVAFIPARVQYDREHLELLRGFGFYVDNSWLTTRSRFQIALGRWCGDHEVRFVDLTSAFREHAAPRTLSRQYGGQLTPEGHALVSQRLTPWLRNDGDN